MVRSEIQNVKLRFGIIGNSEGLNRAIDIAIQVAPTDLAARAGRFGIQRFLSFFLKSPMHDYTENEIPVNHLFQQYAILKNAIREMGGYEADQEID